MRCRFWPKSNHRVRFAPRERLDGVSVSSILLSMACVRRDNDAMSLVLSHSTALLYHRAPARPSAMERYPHAPSPLRGGAPEVRLVERAKELLGEWGVPASRLETIDVLVSKDRDRRRLSGVRAHLCTLSLPSAALIRLEPGIFVADARLCLLQMAQTMNRFELAELCYELCGTYEMPLIPEDRYRERAPLTSTRDLERFIGAMSTAPCAAKARWAVRYARDGARSPMESASVMTIVLPKKVGGLGIRDLVMDHPLVVAGAARQMTRRKRFVADAFIEPARLLIEYMGMCHEDERPHVSDSERENALGAMGYRVVSIWRGALFDRDNYRRVLARICECAKVRPSRFPEGFEELQEALRQFVVRHWTKPDVQKVEY